MGRRTGNILTASCHSSIFLFYILPIRDQSDMRMAHTGALHVHNPIGGTPLPTEVEMMFSISLHKFQAQ